MRIRALFAIALLTACGTATDVIDERNLGCESGQDISIMAGLDARMLGERDEDQFDLMVEVSNNSHEEVTVDFIRAQQAAAESSAYRVDTGYRRFGEVIPEGKHHTFRLPMTGRRAERTRERVIAADRGVELTVTVALSNGDSYRCHFEVVQAR